MNNNQRRLNRRRRRRRPFDDPDDPIDGDANMTGDKKAQHLDGLVVRVAA